MKKIISSMFLLVICCCGCGSSDDSDAVGEACGGLLGLPCDAATYCNFEIGTCGAADQTGTCELRPEICAEIYAPVCGCDDQTYANACEAAGAGVSLVRQGEC